MSSLADRLKALGVKVGAQEMPPPKPRNQDRLGDVIGGHTHLTPFGETYLVETIYPADFRHGAIPIYPQTTFAALAAWAIDQRVNGLSPEHFAFIDTETTGLSGGAGTYAFLIGAARFVGDQFVMRQYFMRNPVEEPAQLAALEAFLAPCTATVTYNGKAFDLPLLANRYISHGLEFPLAGYSHIDLLHLARRLWSDRLPSRTLGNIEAQIIGSTRTADDVPGWMVPQLYFDYLRSGDPTPLNGVFYHNLMDVLSLAALLHHSASLLDEPIQHLDHRADILALARLKEDLGEIDQAVQLYLHGLEHPVYATQDIAQELILKAILRLAQIYKRNGAFPQAVALWKTAFSFGELNACIELAKYYEHHRREFDTAISWTEQALQLTEQNSSRIQDRLARPELLHRLQRLQHKALAG